MKTKSETSARKLVKLEVELSTEQLAYMELLGRNIRAKPEDLLVGLAFADADMLEDDYRAQHIISALVGFVDERRIPSRAPAALQTGTPGKTTAPASPELRDVYTIEQFAEEILHGEETAEYVAGLCRSGRVKTLCRRPYLISKSEVIRLMGSLAGKKEVSHA